MSWSDSSKQPSHHLFMFEALLPRFTSSEVCHSFRVGCWVLCFAWLFSDVPYVYSQPPIEKLIEQLSSDSFIERTAAAEQLRELGKPARQSLEKAARSDNPELAFQADRLLRGLEYAESEWTVEEQQVWDRLRGQSLASRNRTLGSARNVSFEFLFRVLEYYPELAEMFFSGDAIKFNAMLVNAIKQDRWSEVKAAVEHPVCFRYSPGTTYHFHHANGTLAEFLEAQLASIKAAKQDSPRPPQKSINALIAMLRIQGRNREAKELLHWLPSGTADEMYRLLTLESGDWNAISTAMVAPAKKVPGDQLLAVNRSQRAMVYSLTQQSGELEKLVKELEEEYSAAVESKEELRSELARSQLLSIGMMTLDWGLIRKHLEDSSEIDLYNTCASLSRYQDAFQAIDFGDTFEARDQWFVEHIRRFSEAKGKLAKARRGTSEYATQLQYVNGMRQLMLNLIDELGMLGFDAECDLNAQRLFLADEGNFTTRNRLMVLLLIHERYDTLWNLIENGLSKSNVNNMVQQLFSEQFMRVSTLHSMIKPISPRSA